MNIALSYVIQYKAIMKVALDLDVHLCLPMNLVLPQA